MKKPLKPKPLFYANCFQVLQQIAVEMGYNLLIHGSMNRDIDLVAIPWTNSPSSHVQLLDAFSKYLGVREYGHEVYYHFSILPGGRSSYVISLNRGASTPNDPEWYLDISITPLIIGV